MYILQETQNSKVGKRVTGWSWTQLGCRVIATTDCAQNPRGHWNPSWPPGTHSEFWGDLFLADHHITYTKYGVCGVEHAAGQLQPASSDVCIYKLHIYICGIYCFEHHHFYSWVHVFCYHWITVVLLLTDHLGVWGRAFGCINLLQISMYLPPLLDRSPGALYR